MIYFQKQWDAGLATRDYTNLVRLHTRGVAALESLGVHSAFEIGSGLGAFLKAADNKGFIAKGYDPDKECRLFAIYKGVPRWSYLEEEPDVFEGDAIYCVEVFEHIDDVEIRRILGKFTQRYFYFSSTPYHTDQDEYWGHINIKTPEEWTELFKEFGYKPLKLCSQVTQWGIIYER